MNRTAFWKYIGDKEVFSKFLEPTDEERFELFKIAAKAEIDFANGGGNQPKKERLQSDYKFLCQAWEEILKEEMKDEF